MNKQLLAVGGIFSLLLLAGAGCGNTTDTPQTKSANTSATTLENTSSDTTTNQPKTNEFTLAAEAAGNGHVRFTWNAPSNVQAKDGFRFVRGPLENPSYPGNFWYHRPAGDTQANWIKLPKGKQHFRVCAFENKKCTAYSNDVEVTVK